MTSPSLLLEGGRIVDPSQGIDAIGDVLIEGDKIEHAGAPLGDVRRDGGLEVIDCTGRIVSPGFIDVHCHLREPGREDVETIATGARAAAAGGFTAVCAMPNTDPVTDNQAAVGFIVRQAQRARMARVYPIGAVSVGQKGEALAEFGEMVGAGAVAVSDDGKPVATAQLMRTALEYARTFGIPVADHCEEMSLAAGGAMNEGIVSARLGLKGIPSEAEEIMAIRDILLARRTGGHVHLCHMSTRGSVELIRWGKERNIRVTAEVCPHHLSLTEDAVEGYDTNAKMNPPLRTADDVAALQEAVRDGTIDLVATDHAPASLRREGTRVRGRAERDRRAGNGARGGGDAPGRAGDPELDDAGRPHVDDAGEGVRPPWWHATHGKCGRRHSFRPVTRSGRSIRTGSCPRDATHRTVESG